MDAHSNMPEHIPRGDVHLPALHPAGHLSRGGYRGDLLLGSGVGEPDTCSFRPAWIHATQEPTVPRRTNPMTMSTSTSNQSTCCTILPHFCLKFLWRQDLVAGRLEHFLAACVAELLDVAVHVLLGYREVAGSRPVPRPS